MSKVKTKAHKIKCLDDLSNYLITEDGRIYDKEKKQFIESINNNKVKLNDNLYCIGMLVANTFKSTNDKSLILYHIDKNLANNHKDNLHWMKPNITNYINIDLLPLDVDNSPWLYEELNNGIESIDTGKWMLFYDKHLMNDSWMIAKKLYRDNNFAKDVISMKCSTNYVNPRSSSLDNGIIILYCSNSSNKEKIMNIGKKILERFDYKEKENIYYKTDLQTREGTSATGSKKKSYV